MRSITVGNVFGDFRDGQHLLDHFTAIWGGEDGFFHAWRWLDDSLKVLTDAGATRETYPDLFAFADSLFKALESS